jgi:hypothetical protein
VHLAALPYQAAFVGASSSEASGHIQRLTYAEAVTENDASGVGWSHRDLAERYKHLSSCALLAAGIPSVQVGLEPHT